MSSKYKFDDPDGVYFVTMTVVEWIDVFSRPVYKHIIIDSLIFAQKGKGLILHAWVMMSNHLHLIVSASEGCCLSDIIRDFKKFTAKKIISVIQENPDESRKGWMLWIFKSHGKRNPNNTFYQFWIQDNHPVELDTNKKLSQRLDYLHENPVRAEIVDETWHYIYSSAIDYAGGSGMIKVDLLA